MGGCEDLCINTFTKFLQLDEVLHMQLCGHHREKVAIKWCCGIKCHEVSMALRLLPYEGLFVCLFNLEVRPNQFKIFPRVDQGSTSLKLSLE